MDIKDFIKTDREKARQMFSESINPTRDWYFAVFIFSILLIVVLLLSFRLYDGVSNGNIFVQLEKDDSIIENVKSEQLRKNIYFYEMRRIGFSEMKNNISVDPSL